MPCQGIPIFYAAFIRFEQSLRFAVPSATQTVQVPLEQQSMDDTAPLLVIVFSPFTHRKQPMRANTPIFTIFLL